MLLQTLVDEWNSLHSPNFRLERKVLDWSLDRWAKDQIIFFENGRSKIIVKKDGPHFRIHLPVLFSSDEWVALKKQIVEKAKSEGILKIIFGGGLEHLFCGIPLEKGFDFLYDDFLSTQPVQLDFEGEIESLLKISSQVPKRGSLRSGQVTEQYELFNQKELEDADSGEAFLREEFPGRWLSEFERANDAEKKSYFFMVDSKKKICGFVRLYGWDESVRGPALNFVFDSRNTGGLGPVGIAKDLRGQGLGKLILHLAWQKLRQKGIVRVRVDWTTEEKFYSRVGLKMVSQYQPARLVGDNESFNSTIKTNRP